jgi:hypothetical protein
MRFTDLRDEDITGFCWKLRSIIAKKETFTLDHLDRQFPVEIMGMYWKCDPCSQVEINNFEELGIFHEEKTFHCTFSEFPSGIEIKQFHRASGLVRNLKNNRYWFVVQIPAGDRFFPAGSLYITTPWQCALTSVKIPATLQKNHICRNSGSAARMA